MRSPYRSSWRRNRPQFNPDDTNYDLRQALETHLYPHIPKGRQQRSGLLIDFLSMQGEMPGRDHFDLVMLGENRFGVLLLHIPAGVGASKDELFNLKSSLREQKTGESSATTLRCLDSFFGDYPSGGAGVKAFYALLDQRRGSTEFSSAAHPPLLVFRQDSQQIYKLNCENPALGLAPQAYKDFNGRFRSELPSYKSDIINNNQNDLFVFFSPGILEAKNAWGEAFGIARLARLLKKFGNLQPTPFLVEVQNSIEEFTLGEPLQRDVTVIAFKNMQLTNDDNPPENNIDKKFLSIEQEQQVQNFSTDRPKSHARALTDIIADRYDTLDPERLKKYIEKAADDETQDELSQSKLGGDRINQPAARGFHRKILQTFPTRKLLYKKYEFRGNTGVIANALSLYHKGEYRKSLMEFLKVRNTIAESESVHCFFGNLYLLLNMSIKGKQEFTKALKFNPRCSHAYLALGYVSLLHEDFESAINQISIAVRLDASLDDYAAFLSDFIRSFEAESGRNEWIS